MRILEIASPAGAISDPATLAACEPIHRQLRPQLPADYAHRIQAIVAAGAGMVCCSVDGEVAGLAMYRLIENTFEGRKLYVDDLVTDADRRSRGVGHALIGWLRAEALRQNCDVLALDSGTQRHDAHRFYFREGFAIASFSFRQALPA